MNAPFLKLHSPSSNSIVCLRLLGLLFFSEIFMPFCIKAAMLFTNLHLHLILRLELGLKNFLSPWSNLVSSSMSVLSSSWELALDLWSSSCNDSFSKYVIDLDSDSGRACSMGFQLLFRIFLIRSICSLSGPDFRRLDGADLIWIDCYTVVGVTSGGDLLHWIWLVFPGRIYLWKKSLCCLHKGFNSRNDVLVSFQRFVWNKYLCLD